MVMEERDIQHIANKEQLQPDVLHEDQELMEGMLIEKKGCIIQDGKTHIQICSQCVDAMDSCTTGPPKFSLANNLWVGNMPWQFEVLMLPEELLLAWVFPRVFIIKLFPKRGHMEVEMMNSVLQGNVMTFSMNVPKVINMLKGNLMPQPPAFYLVF